MAADRLSAIFPPGNAIRSAAVIVSPRILQAIIAALGDWYTWHLASNVYGSDSNASFFAVSLTPSSTRFFSLSTPLTR